MSLQPIYIGDFFNQSGLETDVKPFMLSDQAFPVLENAYVWRGRVKKAEGNQKLGRLRRFVTNQVLTPADGTGTYIYSNILTAIKVNEPYAEMEAGSLILTVDPGGPNQTVFTDQGNGTFLRTSGTAYNITTSIISYPLGVITLNWTGGGTPPNLTAMQLSYKYFPSLPVMGIWTRDLSTVNDEQTIFFDTRYAYINTGSGFQEWIPGTTWISSDSDFFWATNYRGVEPSDRLMFVTNFVNDANNPIRYTDGNTWTDFKPIIGGQEQEDSLGTVITPWLAFAGTLTKLPIIKGSVVIVAGDITFTDEQEDGTLTGTPGTNIGTINYATGAITLAFNPALTVDTPVSATYNYGNFYLFQAKILIPYYGRLLALNTWEGQTIGDSTNIYNRCRFSQIGSPVQDDAWRSDIFGKGGFIDAPTAETIIGATFYKNTLIVHFERSTWQLRYVGEYGLPFIWERISSDFGSESTFSSVLFDDGVLTVGDKAITTSSGMNVARIDEKIPDLVYDFKNVNNGTIRVHGTRNFQKELVYWCYADANILEDGQVFPNKVLLANYRNKTFAILRDNVTCFGTYQPPSGVTWDDFDAFWDSYDIYWDDVDSQSKFPFIVCGNAQGYISYYKKQNTVKSNQSLSIQAVNLLVSPIRLTIPNHNLQTEDLIYIQGLNFISAITFQPIATDLNDQIYQVTFIDTNTVSISKWNASQQIYINNFSYLPQETSIYAGSAEITLLPKLRIQTKDFNPFQKQGSQLKISYVDLLTDATENSSVSVNLYINSAINQTANVLVGNKKVETSLPSPYYPTDIESEYAWHRFFATSTGQYMRIEMTYDNDLMNTISTHNSDFVLNAMQLWMRPGSRNIFG